MSSEEIAIRVEGIGKCYAIFDSAQNRFYQMFLRGTRKLYREFWALQDVSLTVGRGETVGIVGRNGSGKSTLLQIICGTLAPTTGKVELGGPVAALLELGTGFNMDFTGRENVYVNGAVLGMRKEEIDACMPRIIEFAAIGEFFDRPVKTFSSGMVVRLAISIAFHSSPSILVIDEALAVGDASFQRKCMRRISELVDSGVTLLFVSHDAETVKSICQRAVYLDQGRVKEFGNAKDVCNHYERDLFGAGGNAARLPASRPAAYLDGELVAVDEKQYGDGKVAISGVGIVDESGIPANVLEPGASFCVRYRVRFNGDVSNPVFGMMLTDRNGTCVFGVNSIGRAASSRVYSEGEVHDVVFQLENNLGPGLYYLTCGVHSQEGVDGLLYHHRRMDVAIIKSLAVQGQTCAGFAQLNAGIAVVWAEE